MHQQYKRCKQCRTYKSIESFDLVKKSKRAYRRGVCHQCRQDRHNELFTSEYHRQWYADHKDERCESARKSVEKHRNEHDGQTPERSSRLKHKYGITLDEYKEWAASQCHVCAICKQPCATNSRLSVDHCHKTGKVRGLLCHQCNTAIGSLKDSPELLRRAAEYIEESRSSDN